MILRNAADQQLRGLQNNVRKGEGHQHQKVNQLKGDQEAGRVSIVRGRLEDQKMLITFTHILY